MTPLTTRAARSLCALAAAGLIGFATTPAAASHGRSRPSHRPVHVEFTGSAGTLRVGFRSYQISARSDVAVQIADAFRRSGHRAWIESGRVRVRWCGHRPSVSWSSRGWAATIRCDSRGAVLDPRKRSASPVVCEPARRPSWKRTWRPRGWHGRRDRCRSW